MVNGESGVTIALWPELSCLGEGESVNERGCISHVTHPSMTVMLPLPESANGEAIVICPGGGYGILDWQSHFVRPAETLLAQGYAVIGLRYRVGTGGPMPARLAADDLGQALKLIDRHADEWHLRPAAVTVVGFSAGAHAILTLLTDRSAALGSVRGAALMCPWPNGQPASEFVPGAGVPPLFIATAEDDSVSPPAFADALKAHWQAAGSEAQVCRYPSGGHLSFNFGAAGSLNDWMTPMLQWLAKS